MFVHIFAQKYHNDDEHSLYERTWRSASLKRKQKIYSVIFRFNLIDRNLNANANGNQNSSCFRFTFFFYIIHFQVVLYKCVKLS